MPGPEFSDDQMKLHEILGKIVAYQRSLPEDRAVEFEELEKANVLSPDDLEFMSAHSVTYRPHKLSSFHAMNTLHMPLKNGGCVFTGVSLASVQKRHRTTLRDFRLVIDKILELPRPEEELLVHIQMEAETDGMAVAPGMIMVNFKSAHWRKRLPTIREVASALGLEPFPGSDDGKHILTYLTPRDTKRTVAAVEALLSRGCGLDEESEVVYMAGALDEA